MLILTRKRGESILIGENVSITILGVKGQQVRVGISAPTDVSIHREEIVERAAPTGSLTSVPKHPSETVA